MSLTPELRRDIGLLVLRLGAGGMLALAHGLGKLQSMLAGDFSFADPLGIGAAPSLVLATFGEFVCGLAVAIGLLTRWTALPALVTMLVAALVAHSGDPWSDKELPLLYAVSFFTLAYTGGGRYSIDRLLRRGR